MTNLNSNNKRVPVYQISISVLTVIFAFLGSIFGGVLSTHFSNEHNRQQEQFERRSAAIGGFFTPANGETKRGVAIEEFSNARKYTIYTSKESAIKIANSIKEREEKNLICRGHKKLPDGCLVFNARMINIFREDLGLERIDEDDLKIMLGSSFKRLNEQLE